MLCEVVVFFATELLAVNFYFLSQGCGTSIPQLGHLPMTKNQHTSLPMTIYNNNRASEIETSENLSIEENPYILVTFMCVQRSINESYILLHTVLWPRFV